LKIPSEIPRKSICFKMCLEARHAPSRYVKAAGMLMKAKNNFSVSVFKYRTNQTYMMG